MNWSAADQTVNAVWESSCFSRQTTLDAQICLLFGICSLSQRLVYALGNFWSKSRWRESAWVRKLGFATKRVQSWLNLGFWNLVLASETSEPGGPHTWDARTGWLFPRHSDLVFVPHSPKVRCCTPCDAAILQQLSGGFYFMLKNTKSTM